MKNAKTKLGISLATMLMTICLLLGSTYAWFTDSVSNTGNRIQAGTLKIDLLMDKDDGNGYVSIKNGEGDIFKEANNATNSTTSLWEPGKTQIAFLGIRNTGSLALKYTTYIDVTDDGLCSALEYIYLPISKDEYKELTSGVTDYANLITAAATKNIEPQSIKTGRNVVNSGLLDEIANGEENETDYIALVVRMDENAGNEYQGKDAIIDIAIVATQATAEYDVFNSNQYDKNAEALTPVESIHTSVKTVNTVKNETEDTLTFTTSGNVISASLAKSSAMALFTSDESGNEYKDMVLTLNVDTTENTEYSATYDLTLYKTITTTVDEVTTEGTPTKVTSPLDSHLTATIDIGVGLNNVEVTHSGNAMEKLASADATPTNVNGGYYYDSLTGILTIKSKSFSPFKVMYDCDPTSQVAIVGAGKTTYATLTEFRDSVNSGTNYAGYNIILLKDVDLNNEEWTPIGTSTNPFKGNFDGDKKTIKNLKITEITSEGVGLFGYVLNEDNTIEIKNLKLENVNINANVKSVGALVGYVTKDAKGILISNITVNGQVDGNDAVAGIIGKCYTTATIKYCTNNANVTANRNAAGILGKASGYSGTTTTIQNCTNTGDIYSNGKRDMNAVQIGQSSGNYYNYYYIAAGIAITNGTTWQDCENNSNSGTITSDGEYLQANVTDKKWSWKTFDYTYDLYSTSENSKKYPVVCNNVCYESLEDAFNDLDTQTDQVVQIKGDVSLSNPVTIDNKNIYFIFYGDYTVSGTFKGTNTTITANNDGTSNGTLSLGVDTNVKIKEGTATYKGIEAKCNEYCYTKLENLLGNFTAGSNYDIVLNKNVTLTSPVENLNNNYINFIFAGDYTLEGTFKGTNSTIRAVSNTSANQGTLKVGKETNAKLAIWTATANNGSAKLEGVVAKYNNYYYANLQTIYDEFKEQNTYTIDICADISNETVTKTGIIQVTYKLNGHHVSCSINHPGSFLNISKDEGTMTLTSGSQIYKIYNESNLTITGGKYERSDNGLIVDNYGVLSITGGTFNGTIRSATASETCSLSITGGTFYCNPGSYVAAGYTATYNSGVWTVSKDN